MTEKRTKGITTRVTLPAVQAVAGSILGGRSRLVRAVGFAVVVAGVGSLLKKRLDARRTGSLSDSEFGDEVGARQPSVERNDSPVLGQGKTDAASPAGSPAASVFEAESTVRAEAAEAEAAVVAATTTTTAAAEAAEAAEAEIASLQTGVTMPLPSRPEQAVSDGAGGGGQVDAVPTIVLPVASQPDLALPEVAAASTTMTPSSVTPEPAMVGAGAPISASASVAEDVVAPHAPQPDQIGLETETPTAPTRGRTSRKAMIWSILGSVFLGLIVVGVIAASVIKLPYYRIEPGSVYNTIERVQAPVDQTFIPEGDISFVTVSQSSDINAWQWLDAQLDANVIIKHEDEVNGDQTSDEKREQDQRRMQVSKNSAVVVALERLGFDLISTPLGIEVAQVFDCSAADGILNTGDLIVGVDSVEVREGAELVEQLADKGIGTELELLVDRIDPSNSAATLRTDVVGLTLGSRSDECLPDDVRSDDEVPFIGIGTNTIYEEVLPVEVNIDTGRVGGPSAGLAFTLAIMDVMSEGELTNGLNIVATGTIDREGNVGPVGGIHQKTIAVQRADVDLFIVPSCCDGWVDSETGEPLDISTNIDEALEHAEDGFNVVGVATLDEALAAIAAIGGDVAAFQN